MGPDFFQKRLACQAKKLAIWAPNVCRGVRSHLSEGGSERLHGLVGTGRHEVSQTSERTSVEATVGADVKECFGWVLAHSRRLAGE